MPTPSSGAFTWTFVPINVQVVDTSGTALTFAPVLGSPTSYMTFTCPKAGKWQINSTFAWNTGYNTALAANSIEQIAQFTWKSLNTNTTFLDNICVTSGPVVGTALYNGSQFISMAAQHNFIADMALNDVMWMDGAWWADDTFTAAPPNVGPGYGGNAMPTNQFSAVWLGA
jgi:hypothetical protein